MSELGSEAPRRLTGRDILPYADYAAIRRERRREIAELKRRRRLEVGPFATFYFENFASMRQQVQEMLFIEQGGEAQLIDELEAYNPQIPQGSELIATVMFEIDDPARRVAALARLGGVEHHAFIDLGGVKLRGEPDTTRENTSAEGKASSVQFVKFRFTPELIARFKTPGAAVWAGFDHPNYAHVAGISEPVQAALAEDFD
jgi:Protein of unknown function (DUF3501)